MIFLGDFSFVRIFLKNLYRVTMTTSSVVGIPTGDTFIPRDISVGILKPRGCSYHCDTGRSVARSNFVKIPMKAQKIPRFRVFSQKIPRSTFIPRPLTSEPISP